ncbi:hypothetical protein [Lysinibacillus sp. BPa_S21]|uniref:hypothetical protein n=1 Tax=Lysinibacillus sp. BPa_S21 TaxID=2932478 RepID=UPI002012B8E0|nr:hypothetical protein [Lysinibacillus sp. BPa_S21]MCL1694649.1 hypothetical protein [Lysinibacillus sp. BPa_S21]
MRKRSANAAAATKAAHRTPPGSSALRESEASAANVFCSESKATATNVLSVRKRSDSNKCFICAKAKRQQQSAQPERKSTPRYNKKI